MRRELTHKDILAVILIALVAVSAPAVGALPPPPQWVAAIFVGDQKVIGLRWAPIPGASGYRILRSKVPGSGHAEIAVTQQPQYFDAEIEGGKAYYYRIEVTGGAEGAVMSAEKSVSVPPLPEMMKISVPPPAWKRIEVVEWNDWDNEYRRFKLSWNPVPGAVAYTIYRAEGPGGELLMVGQVAEDSWLDVTVGDMKFYRYAVTALSRQGFVESSFSEERFGFTGRDKQWMNFSDIKEINKAMNLPDPKSQNLVRRFYAVSGGEELKDSLLEGMKSSSFGIRAFSVLAAGLFSGSMEIQTVLEGIARDEDARMRLYALYSLEKIMGPEIVGTALALLRDVSPPVRNRAKRILGNRKIEGTTAPLGKMLEEKKTEVRRAAAWVLMRIASSESREILRSYLHDGDPAVRSLALSALKPSIDTSDGNRLIAALDDPDPTVRVTAVHRLDQANMWNKRGMHNLLTVTLKDPSREVRLAMVRELRVIQIMEYLDLLIAALDDKDPSIRKEAAAALGYRKVWHAVDALVGLLNDQTDEVVGAAEEALTRITGEDYGRDAGKWRLWLEEHPPQEPPKLP